MLVTHRAGPLARQVGEVCLREQVGGGGEDEPLVHRLRGHITRLPVERDPRRLTWREPQLVGLGFLEHEEERYEIRQTASSRPQQNT